MRASDAPLLTAVYLGEPDEVYEFRVDGEAMSFGRDERCNIVIWAAINHAELSRVAGRIWRMEGELWVRNLSTRHEVELHAADSAWQQPLPPRRDDPADPGAARSVGAPVALLRAPGGCEIRLSQSRLPAVGTESDKGLAGLDTVRLPPVPDDLRPVAVAMCEPLLYGAHLPAAYREVALRLRDVCPDDVSPRQVRRRVSRLVELYEAEIPLLRQRSEERRYRERSAAPPPVLRHGVWTFPPPGDGVIQAPLCTLALPDYYEVAHLLVRRRLVTSADLASLSRAR
jgi:hypothetical protein